MKYDTLLGILFFAIGGYSVLLANRQIALNGWYEVFSIGGSLMFVGYLLIGLGLFYIIASALNATRSPA